MLTLLSNILPLYFRVAVLVLLGQNGFVFVVIFGGLSLEPVAERGWDGYASSLLVKGCGWNRFDIQGAKDIERFSRWGRGWDPVE